MRDLDLHDGTASDMTRADHPQNEGEARLRGSGSDENAGGNSRHSDPVFPLFWYSPAGSSTTAGNADRAVLYDFRRFPALIHSTVTLP